jgi:hypothetical protein
MNKRGRLELQTRVRISDTVLAITVFDEPSAEGGIRANVITYGPHLRGPEVWIDAPELRQLRDLINKVLGD